MMRSLPTPALLLAAVLFAATRTLWSAGDPAMATLVVTDMALLAMLVAGAERRTAAMLLAAGLAAGLSPAALGPAVLALGHAVFRRASAPTLLGLPVGAIATGAAIGWPTLAPADELWAALPADATGLFFAVAAGATAWVGATATIRPLAGSELARVTAALVVGSVLLLPVPSSAVLAAVGAALLGGAPELAILVLAGLAAPLSLAVPLLAAATLLLARPLRRPAANDDAPLRPILPPDAIALR